MIALEFISIQWENLDKRADLVAAHQFDHIVLPNGSPLIVKDMNGIHHLLIPIGENDIAYEDKRSSGVHIKISQWGEAGQLRRFIDVISLKPHLNGLFDMIVLDILKGLETVTSDPSKTCRQVISKWRELLSRDPVNLPDRNSLIGIFGELWVLRTMTRLDSSAVDLWVGPQGARFDFININNALEVKTTLQKTSRIVTIHGEKQLEPIEGSSLFLTVLKLEEIPVGGESIIDLVNCLIDSGIDRSVIFSKLINLNITATNINDCSNLKFRLAEEKVFQVDEKFPTITTKAFKGDKMPNGIVDLTYQIDLSSEPPSPLSKIQTEEFYKTISHRGD
jgi:hypothetical protein